MREVSWGTVLRSVQAVRVFCKLRAPPIKLSLHSWTLSNPLVSKIIPLSETCNNSLDTKWTLNHTKVVKEDYISLYEDEPPDVWLRLAKFPKGSKGLGNKGFARTGWFYAFWIRIRTPLVMRTRKVKQCTREELEGAGGKKDTCTLRYSSEVAFSRDTIQDGVKDVIPYWNVALLPYLHAWGHAMMNIKRPLRLPGENSCVNKKYWE